jgi:arginase
VSRSVGVIGVPTSAGAFAPGQEQGPSALRQAGLLEALTGAGMDVRDHGDREGWRWRPDRRNPRNQNVTKVVEIVRDTARRVDDARSAGEVTLVLGGDCTIGIGTVAGHLEAGEELGLIYFDQHADLNVPASVPEGALDWMGMAHMLGVDGAVPELVDAGPRAPLLAPEQVLLFGWGPEQATAFERQEMDERGIGVIPVERVAADPEAAADDALERLGSRSDRLLVHFDVDVIDFTDFPLSENTGRNQGLGFENTIRALARLLAARSIAGLTITELNPDHAEGKDSLELFAHGVAGAVAATPSTSA